MRPVIPLRMLLTLGLAVTLAGGMSGCGRKAINKPVEGGAYPRFYPATNDPDHPKGTITVPETTQQQRQRTAQPSP